MLSPNTTSLNTSELTDEQLLESCEAGRSLKAAMDEVAEHFGSARDMSPWEASDFHESLSEEESKIFSQLSDPWGIKAQIASSDCQRCRHKIRHLRCTCPR